MFWATTFQWVLQPLADSSQKVKFGESSPLNVFRRQPSCIQNNVHYTVLAGIPCARLQSCTNVHMGECVRNAWASIQLCTALTVIERDDVQSVHQLSLVLMNTLDLHIKHRVDRNDHTKMLLKVGSQAPLVVLMSKQQHPPKQYNHNLNHQQLYAQATWTEIACLRRDKTVQIAWIKCN